MFSVSRQRSLNHVVWATTPNEAEYIEAWKFTPYNSASVQHARYGRLHNSEIESWLLQQGKGSPPKPPQEHAKLVGGIRLIIADRKFYDPPSLSISKETYLMIEEEFHLPAASLSALTSESGFHARFETYYEENPGRLKRIGLIIKSPQKYQIGNYGLALSHDFATGITTGILIGTGVIQGAADFPVWTQCPAAEIFDLINAVPSMLAQPIILPTLLLQHHLYRTEHFCHSHLDPGYVLTQCRLGMTRAGRLYRAETGKERDEKETMRDTRVNLRDITVEMNTYMADIGFFCMVSDWHCECAEFLARTLAEVTSKSATEGIVSEQRERQEIKECIEYLDSAARGLRRHSNRCKERAEADFGVLYSIIAQMDNRLNAKMSASSSRDSTAMKTLAFITTLFLPGTFVATIFSMSMFNWQAPTSDKYGSRIVSSYFWIYWAITVPLTLLVALSWRLWWNWEKRNFDRDVRMEIENIEEPGSWASSDDLRKHQAEEEIDAHHGVTWRTLRRRGPGSSRV